MKANSPDQLSRLEHALQVGRIPRDLLESLG